MRIDVEGGTAEHIAEMTSSYTNSVTSNADGVILANLTNDGPIYRIRALGSPATPVTRVDSKVHARHLWPQFFPDGQRFAYIADGLKPEYTELRITSLDRPIDAPPLAVLKKSIGTIIFGSKSYLLANRNDRWTTQRIDPSRLHLEGDAVPVTDSNWLTATSTTLAYQMIRPRPLRLAWHSRDGRLLESVGEPRPFIAARSSPDGDRIVTAVFGSGSNNLSIIDSLRRTTSRFTFSDQWEFSPVWSWDSKWIAYSALRADGQALFRKAASGVGEEERLTPPVQRQTLDAITDWSRDGRFLLYGRFDKDWDLWILPLEGKREPFPFLDTNFREEFGAFSPDSRWIAYTSNESGQNEIYVRDFSGVQPSKKKWHISSGEGMDPRWGIDGRELFFVSQRKIVSVALLPPTRGFRTGEAKVLLEMPAGAEFFDVATDGKRILLGLPVADTVVEPITVVLNWQTGLKP
jgi:hypothetical protein